MGRTNPYIVNEKALRVLTFVYDYDGVDTGLILKAFFPKGSARSYAYAFLNSLVKGGFLNRTRLPSISGVGSGRSFYTLAPRGRRLVSELLDLPRSTLIRRETPASLLFLAHHLRTCATRLALSEATFKNDAAARIVEWRTERVLKAHPFKFRLPDGSSHSIIPDAYFVLETKSGEQAAFCLETDMGTVPIKRWAEKLISYHHGPHPAVLITTATERRKSELVELATTVGQQQGLDPTRYWIAWEQDLAADTVLHQPIWQVPMIGQIPLLPTTPLESHQTSYNRQPSYYQPLLSGSSFIRRGEGK